MSILFDNIIVSVPSARLSRCVLHNRGKYQMISTVNHIEHNF